MSKNTAEAAASQGIGFWGLLGVVFITLKLCQVINWSWWYILAPLYGPPLVVLAFVLAFLLIAAAAYGLAGILEAFNGK